MSDKTYRITIKDRGNLLGLILDSEVSEAELHSIYTVLKIHDHAEDQPCYCAFQFPDAPWSLSGLWADSRRRAGLADEPGSARWVAAQPGYLPRILTRDSPEVIEAKRRAGIADPPDFRQPGEMVNGLYKVVAPAPPATPPGFLHRPEDCLACAIDGEQCHANLDCEHRAWRNGWCFPHQPKGIESLQPAQPVRPNTDADHEMMVANDTID